MRQPDSNTNGRNLRPALAPTRSLPSETDRDLVSSQWEEPRHSSAGASAGGRTPTAPLAAKVQVEVRPGRNVGTRLEDGDWDIGIFLTDLPSRAEHNPVRTEADPEHRVALRGRRTVPEDASALEVCDER
ncbi:hypothetical protein ABZ613_38700 [Streptomyces collinus]|uniref:hypothetical protein n=1 Tax=Streptomyces collinus TaxID=42684 RepID=UPI0033C79584